MRPSFIILATLLLVSFKMKAQFKGIGGWYVLNLQLPGNTDHRWGGTLEVQDRNYGLTTQFYYWSARGLITYNIDKTAVAGAGAGRIVNYGYDAFDAGPQTTENRTWEQFSLTQQLSRIRFMHRYMIEQRWLNTGYRDRFRYMFSATVPINKHVIEKGTFSITGYDELFIGTKRQVLERNRYAALIGYQFNKAFSLQTGWLNQFNNASNGTNSKNYLHINAIYQVLRW